MTVQAHVPDLTGYLDLDGGHLVLHDGAPVAVACPSCVAVNTDADPACSFADTADADPDLWACSYGHRFEIKIGNHKGSPQLRVSAR